MTALTLPTDEAAVERGLAALGQDTSLSLEFHQKVYGDDDDLPTHGKWVVWRETGNINDREWEVAAFGDTPADALAALIAARSTPMRDPA